jgi:putative ABC transport system substrate-binding protein
VPSAGIALQSIDDLFCRRDQVGNKEAIMRRRDVIQLLAGAIMAAPCRVAAQTTTKTYRLASLNSAGPLPANSPNGTILMRALAEHGYTLGQNLEYEPQGANAQLARLPQLARDLAASKVDAVVVLGYPAAAAMKDTSIPTVVAVGAGDPVATGLVASLAHPGGNVTGISDNATTLSTKRLGLLKQAVPNIRKVAMLWNKNDLGMTLRYQASADAAKSLGVTVQALGVGEPDDFEDAFTAMNREPPDAILMVSDALTILNRKRVFDYAAARRLPAIYEGDFYVRDGGLMSYGADSKQSFSRAASLIARIFQGAKPADLPFEEPTRYLLVINLKTAKATGIELPSNFVALADEVIE